MNQTLNWEKPLQTRDGRSARLICSDLKGPCDKTHVVAVMAGDFERVYHFPHTGRLVDHVDSSNDIINVPPQPDTIHLVKVGKGGGCFYCAFGSKEQADAYAGTYIVQGRSTVTTLFTK